MLKFGAVNIDVSHPKMFADVLSKGERGRYTAVYNDGFRGDDEVKAFAEKFNLKICKTLDELVDSVDIGFIHGCNWDKHMAYAEHFIKKNKPVFIDKPMVGNMQECRKLIELVKNGAPIIGTSALRYCDEVVKVRKTMEEQNTRAIHVDVTVGVDDFNYAIHAVEEICGIINDIPVSCQHISAAKVDEETCDTFLIKFKNGATACYHSLLKKFAMFNTIVLTANPEYNTDFCFEVDNDQIYRAMLDVVCDYLEGKENILASMEEMVDAIKIMIAGKASKENGGIEVSLDSLLLEKTSYDGNEFEKNYSATAKKIYL